MFMHTNKMFFSIALVGLLLLAACSSLSLGSASAGQVTQQTGQDPEQSGQNREQPLSSNLAMGTLALEGTDQAVTALQAKDLLPLWKAVKSLSSSETASTDEISALYTQIEETMTAEQVSTIKTKNLTQEELAALMEKLGIEMPQNPMGSLTDDERATRVAQRQQQGGGALPVGPGGGMPGGGMPPDGGGPGGGGAGGFAGGQSGAQITPQPGMANRARGGANLMFVDPLIKLLETRAAE